MAREDFLPSDITEYVLDNVDSYDELNADTKEEGDKVFDEILLKNLPELSEMTYVNPDRLGSNTDLYLFRFNDRLFYVKNKLNISDNTFAFIQKEHARIAKYFEPYIPSTRFISRGSAQTGEKEYLIIQDIGEGVQFKALWNLKGNEKEKRLLQNVKNSQHCNSIKTQLDDIMERMLQMITETGYVPDLDFIINTDTGAVMIFDTDMHLNIHDKYTTLYLKRITARLEQYFDVQLPPELTELIEK